MDWDDAYANLAHIPGGADLPAAWANAAAAFRAKTPGELGIRYGPAARAFYDLFLPAGAAAGVMVFVHGGYWMQTGPRDWSHLAAGALDRGFAVSMPGYTLAPAATLAEMSAQIAQALTHIAARLAGPVALVGHSAGAQLALRQICQPGAVDDALAKRLTRVTGISGVYDLGPLRHTAMNATLTLTEQSAAAESPRLLPPAAPCPVTLWVGAMERPEFLRQSREMAAAWRGHGVSLDLVEEGGVHHFSVLDGLCDGQSPLMDAILSPR